MLQLSVDLIKKVRRRTGKVDNSFLPLLKKR